jgi:glycosyltransferase involved in cell wall biosynthesis
MNFRAIHQALPTLGYGDAIGNQVRHIQALLRARGYASEIFAEHWDSRYNDRCKHYSTYAAYSHKDNLLLLHYSTGGDINAWAKSQADQLGLIYHNITPAHFFEGVDDEMAQRLAQARIALREFKSIPAIADSPYNQLELESLGFGVLGVVPPVLNLAALDAELSLPGASHIQKMFGKRSTAQAPNSVDWFFVGRHVPHKGLHHLIKAFYYFHRFIQPHSRLLLAGNSSGMESYMDSLFDLVTQLGLDGAVVFVGAVGEGLAALYQMADVYVSMSEHEGFCVPLVEAMHYDVPILAYDCTNVPFTLGDAGVLVKRLDYRLFAELAHEMTSNDTLRQQIIRTQRARLPAFAPELVEKQLFECLERFPN